MSEEIGVDLVEPLEEGAGHAGVPDFSRLPFVERVDSLDVLRVAGPEDDPVGEFFVDLFRRPIDVFFAGERLLLRFHDDFFDVLDEDGFLSHVALVLVRGQARRVGGVRVDLDDGAVVDDCVPHDHATHRFLPFTDRALHGRREQEVVDQLLVVEFLDLIEVLGPFEFKFQDLVHLEPHFFVDLRRVLCLEVHELDHLEGILEVGSHLRAVLVEALEVLEREFLLLLAETCLFPPDGDLLFEGEFSKLFFAQSRIFSDSGSSAEGK